MRFKAKTLALPVAAFAAFGAAFASRLAHFGFSATAALTIVAVLLNGLVAVGDVSPIVEDRDEKGAAPEAASTQFWAIRAGGAALVIACLWMIASLVASAS
jgi:hypothetical protein